MEYSEGSGLHYPEKMEETKQDRIADTKLRTKHFQQTMQTWHTAQRTARQKLMLCSLNILISMCHPSQQHNFHTEKIPCFYFNITYWRHKRERSMAPCILNFSIIRVECLDSLPSRIFLWWRASGTQWIGVWVGPGAGVGVSEKTGIFRSCQAMSHCASTPIL